MSSPSSTRARSQGASGVDWPLVTKQWLRRIAIWVPLIALTVWTVLPVLMTLSISFKTPAAVSAEPGLIPSNPTLEGYLSVFEQQGFRGAFVNSVIVGIGTSLLTLALAVPAAYAFARFRFRGRHLLLLFTLLPRLIPGLGLMVPLYRLAVALGAIDRLLTLIVAFTGTVLPLAVWLLVGFFQQIPRDLEEAANVDGAALFTRIRYIVLPLAVPAMITIGVLAFREAWNEFNLVLGLTSSPGSRTLPYELFLMTQTTGFQNNPGQAAFAIMTIIPFI
ncbi:MAG: ABC transporter permease subunit, partial [Acidimicrobiia bacterium]|nr:ABC transporter permease subunit [Acidimicrobiia bacterium]